MLKLTETQVNNNIKCVRCLKEAMRLTTEYAYEKLNLPLPTESSQTQNGPFGDSSDVELKQLDEYLKDRSYIQGFTPTQADNAVFQSLSGNLINYISVFSNSC